MQSRVPYLITASALMRMIRSRQMPNLLSPQQGKLLVEKLTCHGLSSKSTGSVLLAPPPVFKTGNLCGPGWSEVQTPQQTPKQTPASKTGKALKSQRRKKISSKRKKIKRCRAVSLGSTEDVCTRGSGGQAWDNSSAKPLPESDSDVQNTGKKMSTQLLAHVSQPVPIPDKDTSSSEASSTPASSARLRSRSSSTSSQSSDSDVEDSDVAVRVYMRVRPPEGRKAGIAPTIFDSFSIGLDSKSINHQIKENYSTNFEFDGVFGAAAAQGEIFETVASPAVTVHLLATMPPSSHMGRRDLERHTRCSVRDLGTLMSTSG